LHDVWTRYTPPPADLSETTKTDATKPSNGVAHVADVLEISERARVVCDHCQAPGTDADHLLEVIDGSGGALLHRACINPWNATEIPGFYDRRGVA